MLFYDIYRYLCVITEKAGELLWGNATLVLFFAVGLLMSHITDYVQLRHLFTSIKLSLGGLFKKGEDKGGTSAFQALCTCLGATVGTGNIAGVAAALTLGGPGAIFWMWVSAFFGMATKYAEALLAVKFRKVKEDEACGGPMYYIKYGLPVKYSFLSRLFAFFCILASFGMGNMAQVGNISDALCGAVRIFSDIPEKGVRYLVGICSIVLLAVVICGRKNRVGRVCEIIVPFMSIMYIIFCLAVILTNITELPRTLCLIVSSAIKPRSLAGIPFFFCLRQGVSKGVFSNEAGLGSSAISHAASSEKEPYRQGLMGIFEVFADTHVLCTLTALSLLMSGIYIPYGRFSGTPLVIDSFSTVFGEKVSYILISASIAFFAFATLLSWSLYGVRCAEFLFGKTAIPYYKILFLCATLLGATVHISLVWQISDIFNILMAFPNLFAIIKLRSVVKLESQKMELFKNGIRLKSKETKISEKR